MLSVKQPAGVGHGAARFDWQRTARMPMIVSSADLYERLTRENKLVQYLQFGQEYADRDPSNTVFREFEDYISTTDRLEELDIKWDNRCPGALLSALSKGIERNPKCSIRSILLHGDKRPLTTGKISADVFARSVRQVAKFKDSAMVSLSFGFNSGHHWIQIDTGDKKRLRLDQVVFGGMKFREAALLALVEQVSKEPLARIFLNLSYSFISDEGMIKIFKLIQGSSICENLAELAMFLNCDQHASTSGSVVSELALAIKSCQKLRKVEIRTGWLSDDADESNQQLKESCLHVADCKFYSLSSGMEPWES